MRNYDSGKSKRVLLQRDNKTPEFLLRCVEGDFNATRKSTIEVVNEVRTASTKKEKHRTYASQYF